MKKIIFGVFLVFLCANAQAAPIISGSTGLSSPDVLIDFETLTPGEIVTNQLSGQGVLLNGLSVSQNTGISELSGSQVLNSVDGDLGNIYSIAFTSLVSEAGFFLITNPGTTSFQALLFGTVVESFNAATNRDGVLNDFYGFENISFNEIRFQISASNSYFNMDDLQYSASAVPEPTSLALLSFGLAGLGFLRKKKNNLI
jgi:hypothetical protein